MKHRILVLGAGFGGLELCTLLSDALGGQMELTLIDQNESFYFGFSKLDVMFGRKSAESIRIPYSRIGKPGVQFIRANIMDIDPVSRKVRTDAGTFDADILVVALGANYDLSATPGLSEAGNEFYSLEGAIALRQKIQDFTRGHAIVGVCGAPFKCPPAPSEAALMLHDDLVSRGCRGSCSISLVMPFGLPIPPSPDSSKALLRAFEERGIRFVPHHRIIRLDPVNRAAILDDDSEMPFDLFLGIPCHVAPEVVLRSGLAENGWIPVDRASLRTRYPGVYAVGDVTSVGTPKAGVFAEGTAKVAAASILANLRKEDEPGPYRGAGTCYIEFGQGAVGRVDVDFFSGPKPVGIHHDAQPELAVEKEFFGTSRITRWFG